MALERIAIVGAGQAGGRAAEALRREGYKGELIIFGDEPHEPYERPALSKGVLLGQAPANSTLIRPREWYAAQQIELRTDLRIEAIAPLSRNLITADGRAIEYSKLLLCTGSRVRPLTITPDGMRGVHYLRTIADSESLRRALKECRSLVVIGGGFIGLEVASSAAQLGVNVTVVERQPALLDRALPAGIAAQVERLHRSRGVAIELNSRAISIAGGATVKSVVLEDGRELPADVVVIGIGVIPNTELAEAAGARSSDGVVVDEYCRSSLADFYAAGDVTSHYNPILGRHIRLESWQNAQNQAVAAVRNMLGAQKPYAEVPWFWSDQYDCNIQLAGVVEPGLDIVWRGERQGAKCMAFGLLDGKVRLAVGFNAGSELRFARRLVELAAAVPPKSLADPSVKLKDLVPEAASRSLAA
jgi:NADPH-dependent 2,4-dienoyl-CoA reductase/sulfur reductase-like enzyme